MKSGGANEATLPERLLRLLVENRGIPQPYPKIVNAMYPHGVVPRRPMSCVRVCVSKLRNSGANIVFIEGQGWALLAMPPGSDVGALPTLSRVAQGKAVLAELEAAKGEPVSAENLISVMFPNSAGPPRNGAQLLSSVISRLRRDGHEVHGDLDAGFWKEAFDDDDIPKKPLPERRMCVGRCRQWFKPEWETNFTCKRCSELNRGVFDVSSCAVRGARVR